MKDELSIDDAELVEEIAFRVGVALREAPSMDGRCHRVHGDVENQRIARAAIVGINTILRRRRATPARPGEGSE